MFGVYIPQGRGGPLWPSEYTLRIMFGVYIPQGRVRPLWPSATTLRIMLSVYIPQGRTLPCGSFQFTAPCQWILARYRTQTKAPLLSGSSG